MIVGVTGLLGAGKTAWATMRVVELARQRGSLLASNIALTPPAGVEFVQLAVGHDGLDLDGLYALRDRARSERRGLIVLLDEVGLLLPARFWATFPVPLLSFFVNSRKLRVDIWWVSQDENDVEVALRRRTQYVFKVRRWPGVRPWAKKVGRPWLLWVTTWRSGQVEKKDRRIGRSLVVWRRRWESWYDTDELVEPPARVLAPSGRSRRGARAPASLARASDAPDAAA